VDHVVFASGATLSAAQLAALAQQAPTGGVAIALNGAAVTASTALKQNDVLTASNTLSDLDGMGTVSYQWYANGTAIAGATAASLTLGQAQVGQTISVKASYTDGFGAAEAANSLTTTAIINVNDTATGAVSIALSGAAVTTTTALKRGDTLTVSNNLSDLDGMGAVSYQWFANGVAINGATITSLTLGQAQVGQTISVKASYTDGFGTAEAVNSITTTAITGVNTAATGAVSMALGGVAVTTTTALKQGDVLTASNTLADVDGMGTVTYQWFANGTAIGGATGVSLTLAQAQVGKTLSVKASYTDGFGTAEAVNSITTASVANVNDAATGTVSIALNGAAITATTALKQGDVLTASNTLADADGMGTVSYQWFTNGAAIGGATAATLTLAQAQVGQTISVKASYTDGFGTAEAVNSITTASVANVNDAATGAVSIALGGVAVTATTALKQGDVITASNTLADLDGMGAISYQWFANGAAISGATAVTLTLAQAQVGQTISVKASLMVSNTIDS
jgi:hypothetical protein